MYLTESYLASQQTRFTTDANDRVATSFSGCGNSPCLTAESIFEIVEVFIMSPVAEIRKT